MFKSLREFKWQTNKNHPFIKQEVSTIWFVNLKVQKMK